MIFPFFPQLGEVFLQNLYLLATAVMSTRARELQDVVHTKQLKGIRGQHFLNRQTMLAIPVPWFAVVCTEPVIQNMMFVIIKGTVFYIWIASVGLNFIKW